MTDHPITPPDELVQQWLAAPEYAGERMMVSMTERRLQEIADKAARWGFNQRGAVNEAELQKARDEELLESCKWLQNARNHGLCYDIGQSLAANLRAARRPKPPSLKAQALEALRDATGSDYPHPMTVLNAEQHSLICRALETLPDRSKFGAMIHDWYRSNGWQRWTLASWAESAGFHAIPYGLMPDIFNGTAGELKREHFEALGEANRRLATRDYGTFANCRDMETICNGAPLLHESGAPWTASDFWACYCGLLAPTRPMTRHD